MLDDELVCVDVGRREQVMVQHHHLTRGVQPLGAVADPVAALCVDDGGPVQCVRVDDSFLFDWKFVLVQREVVRASRGRAPGEDDAGAVGAESCVADLGESDGGGEGVEVGADVRQDDAQWRVGVHGS